MFTFIWTILCADFQLVDLVQKYSHLVYNAWRIWPGSIVFKSFCLISMVFVVCLVMFRLIRNGNATGSFVLRLVALYIHVCSVIEVSR